MRKILDLKNQAHIASLKHIISFDDFTEYESKLFNDLGVTVYSYSELVEIGKTLDNSLLDEMPKPEADTTDVI